MRKLAITIVLLATLASIHRFVLVPWKCNQLTKLMETALQPAIAGNESAGKFLTENIAIAESYRDRVPGDANLNVAIAASYAMMGRHQEALAVYDTALLHDRRPEMYFNRAGIRLTLGDVQGAVDDFTVAARFNPVLADQIRSDSVRTRVRQEMERVRAAEPR
jgi:tetratricopeptide (TPR) repeat protein